MNHEPTNGELLTAIQSTNARVDDVLDVINHFANHVESELETIKSTMATKDDLARLEYRMSGLEKKMDGLETRVVTKDYLDNKLADLRGEFVTSRRK